MKINPPGVFPPSVSSRTKKKTLWTHMLCQQVDVAGASISASGLLVGQLLQGRDEGLLV